ncbi:BON domain-containing protein [Paraburkholderia xenovorans]|uniref:BON domain-containing protein n=1 Tax=Paraburkholderia xenovorans TaxID=36873 RepID=UPI0038BAD4BD
MRQSKKKDKYNYLRIASRIRAFDHRSWESYVMKLVALFKLLAATAAMAVGCSALAQSNVPQATNDSRSPTVRQVRAAIARTPGVDMSSMAVFVHGDKVLLVGSAHTADQIAHTEAAVSHVPGVTSIDNRLFVKPER